MAFDFIDPHIIIEGRLAIIRLNPYFCNQVFLLNPEDLDSPVVIKFTGADNAYICIYDHRIESMKLFREGKLIELAELYLQGSQCLCGLRIKKGIYFAITEIGTPDMLDSGDNSKFLLTHKQMLDREYFRIVGIHHSTGICIAEPRKTKLYIKDLI